MNPRIIKLANGQFIFEFTDEQQAKSMDSLSEFEHDGSIYKVKSIHPSIDMPGYWSYIVIAREKKSYS